MADPNSTFANHAPFRGPVCASLQRASARRGLSRAGRRGLRRLLHGLGPASLLVVLLASAACTTARYRYDRLDEEDGVDLRDLEDLINDSSKSAAPGERLNLQKTVLNFDFKQQVDEYRIGRNDVLNIFVVDHPEMSSQRVNLGEISGTTVQKDGNVHLPVIGMLKAEGLTVVDFAQQLKQEAAKYIVKPEVSVEILKYGSQKFYVLGTVPRPGAYPVDGDTTLLEAIGLAGGTPPEAVSCCR
jgi:hypothetical protein